MKRAAVKAKARTPSIPAQVKAALALLEKMGSKAHREGLGRYGIVTKDRTLGVPMGMIQKLAKQTGRNHELAAALWESGVYEGRMLAIFVAEPQYVTPAEMEAWARDFDNWAVCDTVCFKLWDRTPHAWAKVAKWVKRRDEFVKRAGFALIASIALHDKKAPDEPFVRALAFIQGAAGDGRNFVKKGVSWALRGIGARNVALKAKASAAAERLAASDEPSARWIGKDALRKFARKG